MTRARPYNRDAALDAALTLFWKKGYHATSLKDLETALRMKPGSIYAAFSSKENLFRLALERYFAINRACFIAAMKQATSPLTGLADFLRNAVGTQTQDDPAQACMLVKTVLNATEADATLAAVASDYLDQIEALMVATFAKAKDLGELPATSDPEWLGRRYQSDLTALKIEAQRSKEQAVLMRSAEARALEIEALRVPQSAMLN